MDYSHPYMLVPGLQRTFRHSTLHKINHRASQSFARFDWTTSQWSYCRRAMEKGKAAITARVDTVTSDFPSSLVNTLIDDGVFLHPWTTCSHIPNPNYYRTSFRQLTSRHYFLFSNEADALVVLMHWTEAEPLEIVKL